MKGFFTKAQAETPYWSERGAFSCASCGLYKSAKTPRMPAYGNFKKGIMVIGEGPGADEDQAGQPWQGKMGGILQRKYKQLGINLFEDCVSLNAVNCRPMDKKGSNRAPTNHEIACCRQNVLAEIQRHKPSVIILHGGTAITSLIDYRWRGGQDGGVTKWAGRTIPDRYFNAWLCPTFHPSYIERQQKEEEIEVWWGRDLKRSFAKVNEPFPDFVNEEDCITITDDISGVLDQLYDQAPPLLAFDIETTGLKPYNTELHEIVTMSFCAEPNRAFAIPAPKEKKHLKRLRRLLEHPKIGKVAANMKFEDNWLTVLHGINTTPWVFDTMLAAHILDNRPGITSLKFQAYIRFGLVGYDNEISPYIKGKSSYDVNRIKELVSEESFKQQIKSQGSFWKLLLYNGIDSLTEYRLAIQQMKEMGWGVEN